MTCPSSCGTSRKVLRTCSITKDAHITLCKCASIPRIRITFASASLDRSIKVWGINNPMPYYTLEGHERGVNTIDYYPSGDKPYILSGANDHTVKIRDYQTKSVVHMLEGHLHNLCSVLFHPKLPLIASASEDFTVMLWQVTTYQRETTLNYGMERAWSLAATKEANKLAIGYDEGCIVLERGVMNQLHLWTPLEKLFGARIMRSRKTRLKDWLSGLMDLADELVCIMYHSSTVSSSNIHSIPYHNQVFPCFFQFHFITSLYHSINNIFQSIF
jgi:WD40 repeat protein